MHAGNRGERRPTRLVDMRALLVQPVPGAYKRCMSTMADKRKQSLYFPEEMLREIQDEATRQDRSLSWIMQCAWRSARATIGRMPGTNDLLPRANGSQP